MDKLTQLHCTYQGHCIYMKTEDYTTKMEHPELTLPYFVGIYYIPKLLSLIPIENTDIIARIWDQRDNDIELTDQRCYNEQREASEV